MPHSLRLRRDGARGWRLADPLTGTDVGGIDYVHSADGNHYRPWLLVDSTRRDVRAPLPQLEMAARAVDDALARKRDSGGPELD